MIFSAVLLLNCVNRCPVSYFNHGKLVYYRSAANRNDFAANNNDSDDNLTPIKTSKDRADVVIILSQIRFGSTFLGNFFNKRNNVAYFYEPLWQFPPSTMEDGYSLISDLARCRFHNLSNIYRKVYNTQQFKRNTFAR